jgi:hypothetical protein
MIKVYDWIHFEPSTLELNKKALAELSDLISSYLNAFENDTLQINRRNYYRFNIQKKLFIQKIEASEMLRKYGNTFVLSESIDGNGTSTEYDDFLFVQTIYALEHLGYLTVLDGWGDTDYSERESEHFVRFNIEIKDSLLSELKQEFQKKNPAIKIENYNEKTGVIKFANNEIHLKKLDKETDAMRLMGYLCKLEADEWAERGEVYLAWGLTDEDRERQAKNKIYYAKQAINEAVAKQTKIEDLIEGGTIKWRINPRYRKS